jgi:hypothetical protein
MLRGPKEDPFDLSPRPWDRRNTWFLCPSFRPGDGTVDMISGSAPKNKAVCASHRDLRPIRQRLFQERKTPVKGYEHQDSCNDRSAQWHACRAIAEILSKNKENIHAP